MERIDDFRTPASQPPDQVTHAYRRNRVLNCPDYLCVKLHKYYIGDNWQPGKLDVEIEFDGCSGAGSNFRVDLRNLRSSPGPVPGEQLMPETTINAAASELPSPCFSPVAQLRGWLGECYSPPLPYLRPISLSSGLRPGRSHHGAVASDGVH